MRILHSIAATLALALQAFQGHGCQRVACQHAAMIALLCGMLCKLGAAQGIYEEPRCIFPEQRAIERRYPAQLGPYPAPNLGRPKTVADSQMQFQSYFLSLDGALEIALQNAEVIRVLLGTTADSTGNTIYDPAITNTQIDVERGGFDPNLDLSSTFNRIENPSGLLSRLARTGTAIEAVDVTSTDFRAGLTQQKVGGGTLSVNANATPTNVAPNAGLALNPQTPTSLDVSYTQPLFRGRGVDVNLAPIVIARINTERSYYQLKNSVQDLIRSVVDGYWRLVAARVNVWAQEQQVDQLQFAYDFFDAQSQVGRADLGDTAQARVSLSQFRANLIAAKAEVLDREAAFFNVLGMPPIPEVRLIPTTPPSRDRLPTDWDQLVATAAENRPDVVERKLQIEIDQQQLNVACNNTLPQLDAVGLYRLNGLSGTAPNGNVVSNEFFQFNDLQLGFSLLTPIGQRATRAQYRQEQINLARDQALLRQELHAVTHQIAENLRNLDTFFAQYEAFKEVRDASRVNLKRQFDLFRIGGIATERPNYLNVLLAVTDWGNAISSEALALAQYNSEQANLQFQTGTILEEHGIFFQDELYASLGPWARWKAKNECANYPQRTPPSPNAAVYPDGDRPAEESFDLESLVDDQPRRKKDADAEVDAERKRMNLPSLLDSPREPSSDDDDDKTQSQPLYQRPPDPGADNADQQPEEFPSLKELIEEEPPSLDLREKIRDLLKKPDE